MLFNILLLTLLTSLTHSTFHNTDKLPHIPRTSPCSPNSNTANGRYVGYWGVFSANAFVKQGFKCGVPPQTINTNGMTHLNLAFAIFNSSYAVIPENVTDLVQYKNFTALKSRGVQTWICVGGGGFGNGGQTLGYWQAMSSTVTNRATFINSLISYMNQWGFQGVDIDWETPQTATDKANLVSLVREMRANPSFARKFGISLAVASYNTTQWFNLTGMAPYVDFYNFMAYDYVVYTPNSYLEGQTDIRVTDQFLQPVLASGVNPAQINLGTALYGRGFMLGSNTSCNYLGCPAGGAPNLQVCSVEPGKLQYNEIVQYLANAKGKIVPQLIEQAAMMQVVLGGNQWFAYDNQYTLYLKKQYANSQCLGGMMTYSLDESSGIGNLGTPPLYTPGRQCGIANSSYAICGYQSTPAGKLCCDQYGYCGTGKVYCGKGCQSGNCTNTPEFIYYNANDTCGSQNNNAACWPWNRCCSQYGYCGTGTDYCGTGCQSGPCTG